MTDQLREAFRDLAADAPEIDPTAVASGRTWERAQASRRRGFVALAVAVIAVLVGGVLVSVSLSGITKQAPADPIPYDQSELAIPNKIWQPSEWTSSTSDDGPLGPLALIGIAPHRTSWFHTDERALFGVSAATGGYRFIDLPDQYAGHVFESSIALSPDGTKVGYWMLGHVPRPLKQSDVTGFAVYDTATGKVSRHLVPTRFGLQPASLTWTGDSTNLVAVFYQNLPNTPAGAGGANNAPALAWNLRDGSTRQLASSGIGSATTGAGATITYFANDFALPHDMFTLDVTTGHRTRTVLTGRGVVGGVFSPDGSRLAYSAAAVGGTRSTSNDIGRITTDDMEIATRPAEGRSTWQSRVVDTGSGTTGVVGWLDNTHLLVEVWSATRFQAQARERLASLDVASGELTSVVQLAGADQVWPSLATDLLDRPFVSRDAPPRHFDPRVVLGLTLGVLGVALLIGLVWWWPGSWRRRRVLVGYGARV